MADFVFGDVHIDNIYVTIESCCDDSEEEHESDDESCEDNKDKPTK